MRKLKENEIAFMKAIAGFALEHQVTTLDAQRVFGLFSRHAASTIARFNPDKNERDIINEYVAAYAEGLGAVGAAVVAAPPGGNGGAPH